MALKKIIYKVLMVKIFLLIDLFNMPVMASDKVTLIKGIFSRSVSIEELKDFVNKGVKKDFLKRSIKKQDEKKIISLLKKEYKAPIVLTSKLLYSNIGSVIINRISKVIYPLRIEDDYTRSLAIKAATIKALAENNEKISVINFLDAYPSEVVAININELDKVINKVESMSELVEFFADSPLEKLKQ